MNQIRVVGQVISCTNYTTPRLFNFNPEPVRAAAEACLASGVSEIEIPEGVLDPDRKFPEQGIDPATLKRTIRGLPKQTRVTATYLGGGDIRRDNPAYLETKKRTLKYLFDNFPHMNRAMLHPPGKRDLTSDQVREVVEIWAELADYAATLRKGFQCCLHNHYDSGCETAGQMRAFLDALRQVNHPALRWGPDTGHSHGLGDQYLPIFRENADLIGNHFHIKARIPAFDSIHSGAEYKPERDIWGNKAEKGGGLYGGFVCCADPEVTTPFKEVFKILKDKARPAVKVITGAIEIDNPRQHPRLEMFLSVLYLKQVHGLQPAQKLTCRQMLDRVFAVKRSAR
jgi:sugar phosphate isomerase/epimerase